MVKLGRRVSLVLGEGNPDGYRTLGGTFGTGDGSAVSGQGGGGTFFKNPKAAIAAAAAGGGGAGGGGGSGNFGSGAGDRFEGRYGRP